jgi:hypothetical protein
MSWQVMNIRIPRCWKPGIGGAPRSPSPEDQNKEWPNLPLFAMFMINDPSFLGNVNTVKVQKNE